MSVVRAAAAALVAGVLLLTAAPGAGAASTAAIEETDPDATGSGRTAYPGDPELEAAVVVQEDRRLLEVGTVASMARWSELRLSRPYRMPTGLTYTLVLTERAQPYTIADLLVLAPQTFVRQPDGAFLLSENLVVSAGASLVLGASDGPLTLRMASDRDGFVSIVNDGGRLEVAGSRTSPVTITSWDRTSGAPDRLTDDGRAYLRSTGGSASLSYTDLRALGFWSGRTGGLALTGRDRPSTGALDELGRTLTQTPGVVALADPPPPPPGQPPVVPTVPEGTVLPAGELPSLDLGEDDLRFSYVSASLDHVTTRGNAFGLFVASADGVDVTDSAFSDALVDGIVLHRYVSNAVVERTSATGNAGDGVVLSRATTGIVLSEVDARDNARNGVTVSGLPLADGPSATGVAVGSYGNNRISGSTVSGNRRYGIEVVGGTTVDVRGNAVTGGDMGIVVRGGARDVAVVGNEVRDSARQAIAVREGASAGVSENVVEGAETSVYVRDARVRVERNQLSGASVHAVTLVGDVTAVAMRDNTLTGRGPSAVDVQRAVDVDPDEFDNDTSGWDDTTPWLVTLQRFLQPLTLMWLLLGALVLGTAVRGAGQPRRFEHPYADKMALQDIAAGTGPRHAREVAR